MRCSSPCAIRSALSALITPWNFPLAIPLWKAAPALAFGNTVVLKPSEHSPGMAHLLAETAHAAELPPGVFNVVHGDGSTGAALVAHQQVRAVSFTGSQGVGARVAAAAAARNIRVQTEMGGKNVVIVARDADLDRAAALTAAGAMRYAGQKCTATSRVIVDRPGRGGIPRATRSCGRGRCRSARWTIPSCAIGPLITHGIADPHRGARSPRTTRCRLFGGALPDDAALPHRQLVRAARHSPSRPPTIHWPLTELFGPVLGVLVADDLEQAMAMANATPFGLSASLFTSDLRTAMQYVRRIEAGLVRVNGDTTGVDPHAPFGGTKGSSSGSREQGRAAREFYTEIRTVQIHP